MLGGLARECDARQTHACQVKIELTQPCLDGARAWVGQLAQLVPSFLSAVKSTLVVITCVTVSSICSICVWFWVQPGWTSPTLPLWFPIRTIPMELKIPIISSEHEQRIPPLPTYWTKFYLRMSWNGKKCNKKIMQPLVFHQNCILPKNVMKYREMQQKKSSNLSFSWKKLFTLNCHEIVKNAIEKSHNLSSGKKNTIDCPEMVRNAIKKSHSLSPNFF